MGRGLSQQQLSSRMSLIVFVFAAAILTDTVTNGQVNVEPNTALLNEGDRTELLCRYGRPISYCRIEIPGEDKVFNLSPEWSKTPGFNYFGNGLNAGQCGVAIERVKALNNGKVKCSLGVQGEELSGTIDLVVALRPQQPIIELLSKPDREGYFNENSLFSARCIVRDGRPAANITWLIDDMPANKRVSQLEVIASPIDKNVELTTTTQEIQWNLGSEDSNRKLVCRSHHQTDRESVPPQEAAYILNIRYQPIRQPETLVYGLYLEHTALVNVTIRASPTPRVEWTVDGTVIPQGSIEGRFTAYEPQYMGNDFYNVTLAIAGLSLEDTTKSYNLRASNALGSSDYVVRISSSSTPPTAGLDIAAIVGIIVAVAVLVLIVLLVLFARATGRWCFGGKSIKTQTNETEKQARQQHGQNVALLETPNGITILGASKNRLDKSENGYTSAANGQSERLSVEPRRRHDDDEDDSFEYATDRESSVYNPTTVPLQRNMMAAAGGRNSQKFANERVTPTEDTDLLTRGSQLGIPESRFSRWIPKDQREILEKQAKLLAGRGQPQQQPTQLPKLPTPTTATTRTAEAAVTTPKTSTPTSELSAQSNSVKLPQETEIYSDTESADIKATSTATAATTATATAGIDEAEEDEATAAATAMATAISDEQQQKPSSKKSKRLPSFAVAILKRFNEKDAAKRKEHESDETTTMAASGEHPATSETTDGNDNEPKEDKQLVYAELVLKPAEKPEPPTPAAKNATEYAEIVYVQKPDSNNSEQSKK